MSQREFYRLSRFAFTWFIIGAMTLNTATAGCLLTGCGGGSRIASSYGYDSGPYAAPCGPVCETTWVSDCGCQIGCVVGSGHVVSESAVSTDCCGSVSDLCCGDLHVESCAPQGSVCGDEWVSDCCSGEYTVVNEAAGCSTPGCSTPGCVGQGCAGAGQATVVTEGDVAKPGPDAVLDDAAAAATAVPDISSPSAGDATVPKESPAAPVTEAPKKVVEPDSVNDLFDNPAPSQPALPEMPPDVTPEVTPKAAGDAFDLPKDPAEPKPLDNLFDDPAANAPAPKSDPAPAATSAPTSDDLFGDPPAATEPAAPAPKPADEPTKTDDFGDLFGSDAPAPDAGKVAPAVAEEPVAPAESAAPADDAMDDLFGTPPADVPVAPATDPVEEKGAPAADTPADDTGSGDFGDLFGQRLPSPREARQMVASGKVPMRTWVDNTGSFRVNASLVEIGSDYVRLMKDNDRLATVPMHRLSDADYAYVQGWANLLGRDLLRLAKR